MADIQLKLHPLWGCRTSIIPTYDPIINKKGHPLRAKQAPTMHLTNPLPLLWTIRIRPKESQREGGRPSGRYIFKS